MKELIKHNNELKECMKAIENENGMLKKTYEQLLQRERNEKSELESQIKEL